VGHDDPNSVLPPLRVSFSGRFNDGSVTTSRSSIHECSLILDDVGRL